MKQSQPHPYRRPLHCLIGAALVVMAAQAGAQVTFYAGEGFRGRAITTDRPVGDFRELGFNDRAQSVVVERGRWEVCADVGFRGPCVVLRRGNYDSLNSMNMDRRISSVRPAAPNRRYSNEAPVPPAAEMYEYRRRPNEAVIQVPVTSVRAVMGPPNQRCWTEVQPTPDAGAGRPNIGGAIVGGLIGGVLGHQIGGGTGKDVATLGGLAAGAAIGSNVNRERDPQTGQAVQRCENVANTTPAYWDVTYNYRGMEHRVQMTANPGPALIVNERTGEPRQ